MRGGRDKPRAVVPVLWPRSGSGKMDLRLRVPLPEQRLHLGAQRRGDVVARQSISDIGRQETDLAAAIEAAAFELEPIEWLFAGEPDHRVGDLDLAPGAPALVGQDLENLRLQNIAAGDDQV